MKHAYINKWTTLFHSHCIWYFIRNNQNCKNISSEKLRIKKRNTKQWIYVCILYMHSKAATKSARFTFWSFNDSPRPFIHVYDSFFFCNLILFFKCMITIVLSCIKKNAYPLKIYWWNLQFYSRFHPFQLERRKKKFKSPNTFDFVWHY